MMYAGVVPVPLLGGVEHFDNQQSGMEWLVM